MMISHTRALVACPGGVGTCDELFEIITLVQTGKHPPMPIVLFGKSYWSQVINFEKMAAFVRLTHKLLNSLPCCQNEYYWITFCRHVSFL